MRGWLLASVVGLAGCGSGGGTADGPDGDGDGPGTGDDDAAPADARVDASADARFDAGMTQACTTVLLYNDCDPVLDANCSTIAEPLRADDAAAALGLAVLYGGNHDQAAFRALFDGGGFEAIVFESSSFDVDVDTATRLAAWIGGGGRIVLSFWDLDNATVGATLRTALAVDTTASFTTPITVYDDPAAITSVFDHVETVPSPLNPSNAGLDDGDQLALAGAGFLAARFTSPTGPGAIAVTHGGSAIVLGFLPIELVYQNVRDDDADGKPDVEELYTNALARVCGI